MATTVMSVTMADNTTMQTISGNVDAIENALQNMENMAEIVRYGVKITKGESDPDTRVEYTYDAEGMRPAKMNYTTGKFDYGDWADVWFVKENYPCMLKYDGTVDYKLDPDDLTKKEDGVTVSDVANINYEGNAMSAIPQVWVSFYQDNTYEYITVSNHKYDNTYHAIAHTLEDQETVIDEIFLSIFRGSLDGNGRLRSISGQTLSGGKTAQQEVAAAQANNPTTRSDTNGWYTRTWGQRQLINALLLIMSRSDNTQATFGNGNYTGGTGAGSLKQTGTLNDKGAFYGTNGTGVQMKVFNMEAWWGDQWDRIAGLINDNGTIKYTMTGPYNFDGTGYKNAGCAAPSGASGGYISSVYTADCGRMPVVASGSATTYLCDGLWFNNGQVDYARVGGNCCNALLIGASVLHLNYDVSDAHWSVGASLSYVA